MDNATAYKDVIARSLAAAQNNGRAYNRLVDLLSEDGFDGKIFNEHDDVIVKFLHMKRSRKSVLKRRLRVYVPLQDINGLKRRILTPS